jgi:hypothetical protein
LRTVSRAGDARFLQPLRPLVEDRVEIVVVEAAGDVRIAASDDEDRREKLSFLVSPRRQKVVLNVIGTKVKRARSRTSS